MGARDVLRDAEGAACQLLHNEMTGTISHGWLGRSLRKALLAMRSGNRDWRHFRRHGLHILGVFPILLISLRPASGSCDAFSAKPNEAVRLLRCLEGPTKARDQCNGAVG